MAIARTEPIVHPEYPKCVDTHIWEISEGVFDFIDETENFFGGEYKSIEEAKAALEDYCAFLDHGSKKCNQCSLRRICEEDLMV